MFGIVNVNKPPDVTSRDVVNVVQRLVRPHKSGHAGTLDPMATGVLLICIGKATRLVPLLHEFPKQYEADVLFGQTSDTDDATGCITKTESTFDLPDESALQAALPQFTGKIQQVPPAWSAIKVAGQRAYSLARKGQSVELKPRTVIVHSLELLRYDWPMATIRIECGSGTYIRSLARDLGQHLGCGALLSRLVRTRIGPFDLQTAVNTDRLTTDNLADFVQNPVCLTDHLPRYCCSAEEKALIAAGRPLQLRPEAFSGSLSEDSKQSRVSLVSADSSQLLALAEYDAANKRLQPRTVFVE